MRGIAEHKQEDDKPQTQNQTSKMHAVFAMEEKEAVKEVFTH